MAGLVSVYNGSGTMGLQLVLGLMAVAGHFMHFCSLEIGREEPVATSLPFSVFVSLVLRRSRIPRKAARVVSGFRRFQRSPAPGRYATDFHDGAVRGCSTDILY